MRFVPLRLSDIRGRFRCVYGVPDGRKERREEIVPRAPLLNGVSVCVCVWYRLLMVLGGYLALSGGVFSVLGWVFLFVASCKSAKSAHDHAWSQWLFLWCAIAR